MAETHGEIRARLAQLKKQAEDGLDEHAALVKEAERLIQALDWISGGAETATADDIDKFKKATDAFKARMEAHSERVRSTELEISELEKFAKESDEQYRAADVEGDKLYFEIYKLVATLATGVLVAVTAITAGLIHNPNSVLLLALAYTFLLGCITFSVVSCMTIASRVRSGLTPGMTTVNETFRWWHGFPYLMSIGGLALGTALASIFLSLNYDQVTGASDHSTQNTEQGNPSNK